MTFPKAYQLGLLIGTAVYLLLLPILPFKPGSFDPFTAICAGLIAAFGTFYGEEWSLVLWVVSASKCAAFLWPAPGEEVDFVTWFLLGTTAFFFALFGVGLAWRVWYVRRAERAQSHPGNEVHALV